MPGLRTGADKQRSIIERKGEQAIAKALKRQMELAIGRSKSDVANAVNRLDKGRQGVFDAVLQVIENSVLLGVDIAHEQLDTIMGVKQVGEIEIVGEAEVVDSWTLVNTDAVTWATKHAGEVSKGLDDTSREIVKANVVQWMESGEGLEVLKKNLVKSGFSKSRARTIAHTETTKAYAEGNLIAWEQGGMIKAKEWRTANDEAVCPICAPLGGLAYGAEGADPASIVEQESRSARAPLRGNFTHPGGSGLAAGFSGAGYQSPPAHPNCRCWMVPVVIETAKQPIPQVDRTIPEAIQKMREKISIIQGDLAERRDQIMYQATDLAAQVEEDEELKAEMEQEKEGMIYRRFDGTPTDKLTEGERIQYMQSYSQEQINEGIMYIPEYGAIVKRLNTAHFEDKKLDKLNRELLKENKEKRKQYTKILSEGNRKTDINKSLTMKEAIEPAFHAYTEPRDYTVDLTRYKQPSQTNKLAYKQANEWVSQVTDGFVFEYVIEEELYNGEPAHYKDEKGIIRLDRENPDIDDADIKDKLVDPQVETLVHELAHRIEDNELATWDLDNEVTGAADWHKNSEGFIKSRLAPGEKAIKLADALADKEFRETGIRPEPTPYKDQYGDDVMTFVDKFDHPYTGRVYPERMDATEVYSMGLQALYNDAGKFAAEDPEYFEFIVDSLKRPGHPVYKEQEALDEAAAAERAAASDRANIDRMLAEAMADEEALAAGARPAQWE